MEGSEEVIDGGGPPPAGLVEESTRAVEGGANDQDHFDDPEPLHANATEQEKKAHKELVVAHANEMYATFKDLKATGAFIWLEFTATFRPENIPYFSKPLLMKWVVYLIEKGVYVKRKQGFSRVRALQECLQATKFIPLARASEGGPAKYLDSNPPEQAQAGEGREGVSNSFELEEDRHERDNPVRRGSNGNKHFIYQTLFEFQM